MANTIFIIIGKSGSGKSFLLDSIMETYNDHVFQNFKLERVAPYTTRPIRNSEIDGVDYYFIDNKIMDTHIAHNEDIDRITYNVTNGDKWDYYYNINSFNMDTNYILIDNPKGIKLFKNYFKDKNIDTDIKVIHIHRDDDRRRIFSLIGRDTESIKEICRRFLSDEEDFNTESLPTINIDIDNNTSNHDYYYYDNILKRMQNMCEENIKEDKLKKSLFNLDNKLSKLNKSLDECKKYKKDREDVWKDICTYDILTLYLSKIKKYTTKELKESLNKYGTIFNISKHEIYNGDFVSIGSYFYIFINAYNNYDNNCIVYKCDLNTSSRVIIDTDIMSADVYDIYNNGIDTNLYIYHNDTSKLIKTYNIDKLNIFAEYIFDSVPRRFSYIR